MLFVKDYIGGSIVLIGKEIDTTVPSQSKHILKNINEISPSLYKQESYTLHSIVAEQLRVTKW